MKKVIASLAIALLVSLVSAQTITVAAGAVGQELELTKAGAERYMEQNPGVTVEVLETGDLADDRLSFYLQLFEAQSPDVDVMQIDVIWPGDLQQHFVDLFEYGAREVADQHFDAIVQNNTVDGKLVGIPWFTDAGLLYYRTDMLEKYGFDAPPETWTELEDMAEMIQAGERAEGNPDFWGFVWQGNAYEGLTCDALEWVASHDGGTIVSSDGVITINNEAAVTAIEKAAGWVGTISPSGVTGFQEEDARNMFQAGNAAFMRNWPYAYSLGQEEGSAVAGLIGVTALPSADVEGASPAATLGGWQLAVNRYTDAPPAVAADFVMFATNYENQLAFAIERSKLPTIEAVYQDPALLESDVGWFNDLLPVFQNAVARPS